MKMLAILVLSFTTVSFAPSEIEDDYEYYRDSHIQDIVRRSPIAMEGIIFPGHPTSETMIHTDRLKRIDPWKRMNNATRRRGTIWPSRPSGTCDTKQECKAKVEEMCSDAGHGGVKEDTVKITKHTYDDGKTCSGDCEKDGAVAFVTCNPPPSVPQANEED